MGVDQEFPETLTEPAADPSTLIVNETDSPSGSLNCPCIDHFEPSQLESDIDKRGGELSLEIPKSYEPSIWCEPSPWAEIATKTTPGIMSELGVMMVVSPDSEVTSELCEEPSCNSETTTSSSGHSLFGVRVIGWGSESFSELVETVKGTPRCQVLFPDDCIAESTASHVTSCASLDGISAIKDLSFPSVNSNEVSAVHRISNEETPDSSVNHVEIEDQSTHVDSPG